MNPSNLASKLTEKMSSGSQNKATDASSKPQDVSKLSPEEMFETTVDKDGNIVTDQYAFTDGRRMSQGKNGQDEADAYEAATADFD